MTIPDLHNTSCPLCGPGVEDVEVYPQRLEPAALSPAVFSARREPDRLHFRIVRCSRCGLLRSNPFVSPAALGNLYRESSMTYANEVANLRRTYANALRRLRGRGKLLEVGCGSGFFLEAAEALGYEAWGIEPSRDARSKAKPSLRDRIIEDVFRSDAFSPCTFDVVAAFQVLDHLPEPL